MIGISSVVGIFSEGQAVIFLRTVCILLPWQTAHIVVVFLTVFDRGDYRRSQHNCIRVFGQVGLVIYEPMRRTPFSLYLTRVQELVFKLAAIVL